MPIIAHSVLDNSIEQSSLRSVEWRNRFFTIHVMRISKNCTQRSDQVAQDHTLSPLFSSLRFNWRAARLPARHDDDDDARCPEYESNDAIMFRTTALYHF